MQWGEMTAQSLLHTQKHTRRASPGIVILFLNKREGENFRESREVIWRMQTVVEQPWSSLGKPQTDVLRKRNGGSRNSRTCLEEKDRSIASGSSAEPVGSFPASLNIEASAAAHWAVCSDLGLHLPHPGHVPVPRRNVLLLPKQVAVRSQRWIQDAEGGSWRREVWAQRKIYRWSVSKIGMLP